LFLSAGNRRNQIGKEMALFSQSLLSLGAPDCPVVHRTVSGVPGRVRRTCCSREVINGVRLKFTGLSGEPTVGWANGRPRDPRGTSGRANGQMGAPDCPMCTGQCPMCTGQCPVHQWLQGCQRSASPNKEGNPHRTVSGGAPDCPVRQATEGKN
jgi:hypothetical protein